jgi:iron complex transport system substrate-binding protein
MIYMKRFGNGGIMNFIRKVILLVLLSILIGCGGSDKKTPLQKTESFTDAMQRQVTITKPIKRIVSMAPNVTEMLFAIGLSEEIVGVTTFCDYPDAAKTKTKIGGYYDPNIEVILSLDPDLIVATPDGYSQERIGKLEQSGIPIFLVNPQNIDQVLESMLTLGDVTGKEKSAKRTVTNLRFRVQLVRSGVSYVPMENRPKVFYEIGHDPLITVGPNTFVDNLITTAGGINVASDAPTDWPRYSIEAVITKEPDIIITAPHASSEGEADSQVDMEVWRKYRTIPAVKNNRIYPVNSDILLRSGPRIVDGLEKLHSLFASYWEPFVKKPRPSS